MAVAMDDVFVGGQLPQTHGAPGVEPLGGDAHFTAQTELSPVSEPGGGVDIHGGTVHQRGEHLLRLFALGDDGLAVPGGVGGNVGYGFPDILHALDGEDVVQKFGVEVLFSGELSGDDGGSLRIQSEFHPIPNALMQHG